MLPPGERHGLNIAATRILQTLHIRIWIVIQIADKSQLFYFWVTSYLLVKNA